MNDKKSSKVSIEAIKQLRAETGAGIHVCKKALESSGGDHAEAKDYIIQKGLAKQTDSAFTDCGYVGIYCNCNNGICIAIEVMSKTDFVSKSASFRASCNELAEYLTNNLSTYQDKIDAVQSGTWLKIQDFQDNQDLINKFISLGEPIAIGRCAVIKKQDNAQIYTYIHSNSPTNVHFCVAQIQNTNHKGEDLTGYGDSIAKHMALYSKQPIEEIFALPFIDDTSKTLANILDYKQDILFEVKGKVGYIHVAKNDVPSSDKAELEFTA